MNQLSNAEVGRQVKARRLELELSESRFIALAGIDLKTLQRLEDGSQWPWESTRLKVERALGWPPGGIAELRKSGNAPPLLSAGPDPAVATIETHPPTVALTAGFRRRDLLDQYQDLHDAARHAADLLDQAVRVGEMTRDQAAPMLLLVAEIERLTDELTLNEMNLRAETITRSTPPVHRKGQGEQGDAPEDGGE